MKLTKEYEIGGVMRCCIATLEESDVKEEQGEIVKCKYCDEGFEFDGEAWKKWWGDAK